MLQGSWKFWSCSIDWSSVIDPTTIKRYPPHVCRHIYHRQHNRLEGCEFRKTMRCAEWIEVLLENINEIRNETCDVKEISYSSFYIGYCHACLVSLRQEYRQTPNKTNPHKMLGQEGRKRKTRSRLV